METFVGYLHQLGARVCGICDNGFIEVLPQSLRESLTLHYSVPELTYFPHLESAVSHFRNTLGEEIHLVESLNECFLHLEGQTRDKFGIPGDSAETASSRQCKSFMKKVFLDAGIPCARGGVYTSVEQVEIELISACGYPIIAKPDKGVGAQGVRKISNKEELERFFLENPQQSYGDEVHATERAIFEEYISGDLFTFETIIDSTGRVVFYGASRFSSGVLEMLEKENENIAFYTLVDIPDEIIHYGTKALAAFHLTSKATHIEFFQRHSDGQFIIIEVNFRAPGGCLMELHAQSLGGDSYPNNVYEKWARVVLNKPCEDFDPAVRKWSCAYLGRKHHLNYRLSETELEEKYGDCIVASDYIPHEMQRLFGNGRSYILKTEGQQQMEELIHAFQQKV